MSTSAIITNRTVSTRSLPDRPNRGALARSAAGEAVLSAIAVPCLPEPPQQDDHALHKTAGQNGGEIGHGGAFSNFRERGVRYDHAGEGANVELEGHSQG